MYSNQANSSIGTASAPREMSGLDHALNGLANGVSEMDASLDQLEKTLYLVLRSAPPQPVGNAQAVTAVSPVQSQAVDQLQAQRQRLERLICRVNDIASRFD